MIEHAYVEHVASGWRVSRPSGWAFIRALETKEQAYHWLENQGFHRVEYDHKFDHWQKASASFVP